MKDICDECKTNEARISSYVSFNTLRRLCNDCYKRMLDEVCDKLLNNNDKLLRKG